MTTRPSFLTTKGERKRATFLFDPLARYRQIAKGIYEWSNLPEDVPEGYIEEALFNYGGISAKVVQGLGICIMPASPRTYDIYGQPLTWLPTGLVGIPQSVPLMEESANPVLWLGAPLVDQVELFAQVMKSSLISLQQNVIALRQPIAIDGNVGNSANACVLSSELEEGELFIPVINSERLGVQVIDLKAVDHTQSLIATYNAMDNEILTVLGVKNTGTEKASGITIEETRSVTQELTLTSTYGLKKRQKWCEKINKVLGTDFWVEVSSAYKQNEVEAEDEGQGEQMLGEEDEEEQEVES